MQGFIDEVAKEVEPFRDWIMTNKGNPFMWGGLFMLGLAVFGLTYSALQKEK